MYEAAIPATAQPVPNIDVISPAQVYQLLAPWKSAKGVACGLNGELAKTFNTSPTAIDGIIVHPTRDANGQLTLVINPTLVGQSAPIRSESVQSERNNGETTSYFLTEAQQAERRRPSTAKRLGQMGLAGVPAAFPAYELATTVDWALGGLSEVAAGAVLYGAGKLIGRNRGKKQAIQTLRAFGEWTDNPQNGAITFAREAPFVYGEPRRDRHTVVATPDEYDQVGTVSKWLYQHRETYPAYLFQDQPLHHVNGERQEIAIQPGKLVFSLLKHDASPAELWTNEFGFGDKARELAAMEQSLLHDRQVAEQITKRHEFTGHYAPGEPEQLRALQNNMAHQQVMMLQLGLKMAEHCMERHNQHSLAARVEKTAHLISEVVDGTAEAVHPLELHLQVMYSVASEALATLALNQDQTLEIVKELGTYLKGTRKLLTDRNQMEQFYNGMRDKFVEKIPSGLPEWQDVVGRLPAVEA